MTQTVPARPDTASDPASDDPAPSTTDAPGTRTPAETLDAAVGCLRGLQHPDGWWKGELQTNVTMDAEDLLLREFLGIRTAQETEEAARWIRSQQRSDGTWAAFEGGPPELSTTVEAWVALRLAGDPVDAPHMRAAEKFVRANGGLEATRVFTRIWLALFGLWSWDELPDLPPEMIFLPSWFPLNVYDWACWARQTVVPLTVVGSLRPCRPLPFGVDELRTEEPLAGSSIGTGVAVSMRAPSSLRATNNLDRPWTWSGAFQRLDKLLHAYSKVHVKPLRRLARRRAIEWILARQEADGSWGGIQPPWVYSILALHLMGYPLDHPSVRAGLAGLEGFIIREETPDGWVRRLEACQSPVWDTGLALTALLDAGVAPDDPAVLRATDWLLGEEIRVPGDWAVRRPNLAPGGWAFEFANDGYPDTDDTAEIVLALRRVAQAHPEPARVRAAIDRGMTWTVGMQSSDGGWGAFDADNTQVLCTKLPFCDFGAVIDPPSADVTAHIVEALAAEGQAAEGQADSEACRRGVAWLLANHVYGTGAVVPALVAAGIPTDDPVIRRAVRWLERHQNPDGGWGEDLRSYVDPEWIGRGHTTPSQTAWALLALLAAGERDSAEVAGGVGWLCAHQRADGGWDEPYFTGTGFPGDFYLNYHLYRMVFPISALGRYLKGST
jgi:squalene-hopene/tetraprenyl-beta-curcumene cyclase